MLRYSFIFLFLILASCGSRKVAIDKVDNVSKIDSVSVSQKETVSVQENHVNITEDVEEFEISPIDTTKSITVNGKTYHNVRIRYKKAKKVLVDTTKIKVAEKALIKVSVKKDSKVKTFKKDIDKKESRTIYWWWLLIILLVILFFYARNRLHKMLP